MSKIKYIAFFKKDAVFDSERIVGELLDVCEQRDLGDGGTMCRMQVVQGELVHCKDCKHWFYFIESEKHHCTELDKHPWDCPIREEDDFCSRGELK